MDFFLGVQLHFTINQNEIIAISGDLNVDEIVKIVENINSL